VHFFPLDVCRPFLESAKKDDLADAFLQGLWYLEKQNRISIAANLKINIVQLP
jgi:hypothetical protein